MRIAVATLDYLSNIRCELEAATLIAEASFSELENLAMRDGLTGLFNRSSSRELLALDLRNRRRHGADVSVIVLDVDDFKSINDRSGHQEGDRVLVEVAETMVEQTRDSDLCCRVGGDEFLVILRDADATETLAIAQRIRREVETIATEERRVGISLGIALSDHATTSPAALMRAADRALYEAKAGGKNQIVLAGHARSDHSPAKTPE